VIVIAGGRLVGEGTPGELSAQLGSRERIVIRVDGPAGEVAAALARVPDVVSVRESDGCFVLEASRAGDSARAAGEEMQRRGWSILELRREAVDLEDVFLRLVGERKGAA
jgi:ABC-type multidrug transport system ATPase subunit